MMAGGRVHGQAKKEKKDANLKKKFLETKPGVWSNREHNKMNKKWEKLLRWKEHRIFGED